MKDRVGQVWKGLDSTHPERLLLVCSRLEEREHHYGYLYRTYLCLDLETGDMLARSESERLHWDQRAGVRIA